MERNRTEKQIADHASRGSNRQSSVHGFVKQVGQEAGAGQQNQTGAAKTDGAPHGAAIDRGSHGYMQYVNALIGCSFIIIAIFYALHPSPLAWAPYAVAAALALVSLKPELSLGFSRVLAISTTALMFFFFAGFFVLVPKLATDWYTNQEGWQAVCRIFGAFAMIPILSDYSCRLKAECREARYNARRAFFSAPEHVRHHN